MALTIEWKHRIDRWQEAIWKSIYRPIGNVALSGFISREQLTAKQALTMKFTPMPPGTHWGAKWEYSWMRGEVSLPPEAAGKRIVVKLEPGGTESLVWINGQEAGSTGWGHREITLARSGKPGEHFDILLADEAPDKESNRIAIGRPAFPQDGIGKSRGIACCVDTAFP